MHVRKTVFNGVALALAMSAPLLGCSEDRVLPRIGSRPGEEPAAVAAPRREAQAERVHPEPRPEPPPPPPGLEAPPDVAAAPPEAERTASGLASRVLQPGTGDRHPGPRDEVSVHYTGWRAENGEMFDSSVRRGRPASFTLDRVIPGWTEGVQRMVEGERRRFWIPANLAYEGRPSGPQGMLVFDVELIRILTPEAPAP
jgi:peptidylprolyl isomerase